MGHIRLGSLPKTRPWKEVVELIHFGAGVEQIANAVLRAAEKNLQFAGRDPGVIESVWLLMHIPFAARSEDFAAALRELGLAVDDSPGLFDLIAATSEQIDRVVSEKRGRSDLGEIAQMALAETFSEFVGRRVEYLFGTTPDDVQRHFATLATVKQFGLFAKDFFARVTEKTLNYFLSKTTPDQLGEGHRFASLADQSEFFDALHAHCRETAKIVEAYSGEFLSKTRFEMGGAIDRETASNFASYAFKKLIDALTREGELAHV